MTTTPVRRLPGAIEAGLRLVDPALRAAVREHLCGEAATIARYHQGWIEADGTPTSAWGGKLLRPALALLGAQAAGGPAEGGVPAAVAIEFVHNFSLLHDDIMDGDTERRGRATAWTVFGVPQTILSGDALLTAAVSVLLDSGAPGAARAATSLMTGTQRMITGQASDVDFERRDDVTLAECVRMAGDKTGALLACACSLGAALVGADRDLVDRLAAFGENVGLAFQLVDDLLGIWGDPDRTGKQVGADLRARKKSLPVVAALNAPGSTALATAYLRPGHLDEQAVAHVTALIESLGGRAWAQDEAERRIAAARDALLGADLPDDVRQSFFDVAAFITGRAF
ncbi:polyprenyl synthetase family protein [Actinokineospora pegani]|uniref:polyprenyl synthetase family protein n=1 Tax=Actinokineospora pegani TaxID=2654637 RepID=UPI0012EA711C|nr:polyprenyl synthetase family protein [Actinokineospora pegani]